MNNYNIFGGDNCHIFPSESLCPLRSPRLSSRKSFFPIFCWIEINDSGDLRHSVASFNCIYQSAFYCILKPKNYNTFLGANRVVEIQYPQHFPWSMSIVREEAEYPLSSFPYVYSFATSEVITWASLTPNYQMTLHLLANCTLHAEICKVPRD